MSGNVFIDNPADIIGVCSDANLPVNDSRIICHDMLSSWMVDKRIQNQFACERNRGVACLKIVQASQICLNSGSLSCRLAFFAAGFYREPAGYGGAISWNGFDFQPATMLLKYLFYGRQAKSGAVFLGGK